MRPYGLPWVLTYFLSEWFANHWDDVRHAFGRSWVSDEAYMCAGDPPCRVEIDSRRRRRAFFTDESGVECGPLLFTRHGRLVPPWGRWFRDAWADG